MWTFVRLDKICTKSVEIFSSLVKVHIRPKCCWDCITLFQMKQNWLWTVSYHCTQFYNHMQSLVLNTGSQSLHLPACFHFPLPCGKVGQHPNKPTSLGKYSSHNIMKSSTFQFVYNKNSKNTEVHEELVCCKLQNGCSQFTVICQKVRSRLWLQHVSNRNPCGWSYNEKNGIVTYNKWVVCINRVIITLKTI